MHPFYDSLKIDKVIAPQVFHLSHLQMMYSCGFLIKYAVYYWNFLIPTIEHNVKLREDRVAVAMGVADDQFCNPKPG